MRKTASLILAVVLGGGIGMVTAQPASAADRDRGTDQQGRQQAQEADRPQLPNGFEMKDINQLDQIREELANIVQTALSKDDFPKLIDNLAEEARDHYKGDYKTQDFTTLNGIIDQIHNEWKQKYGHDFDIKGANGVFDDSYVTVQGVVTNAEVAAANFPVPASKQAEARADQDRAQLAAARERGGGQAQLVERDDLQKSGGVALVRFPAMQGLPELTASLIREKSHGWRVDVPLSTSSRQLHTEMSNQLTYFAQKSSEWPSNETDAYRMAAHRVCMALYNARAPEAGKGDRSERNR